MKPVADKIWAADELLALDASERAHVIDAALVTDIEHFPEHLLERAQERVRFHIGETSEDSPGE